MRAIASIRSARDADLGRRLLAADVEDGAVAVLAGAGRPRGDVEEEGGLADAGLAGDEDDRPGDEAAAEHPVELGDPGGAGDGVGDVDVADGQRRTLDGGGRGWCARVTAPASATVPHAWHSPQRPTHFAVCHPHSEQRYAAAPRVVRRVVEAMAPTLGSGADTSGTPSTAPARSRVLRWSPGQPPGHPTRERRGGERTRRRTHEGPQTHEGADARGPRTANGPGPSW